MRFRQPYVFLSFLTVFSLLFTSLPPNTAPLYATSQRQEGPVEEATVEPAPDPAIGEAPSMPGTPDAEAVADGAAIAVDVSQADGPTVLSFTEAVEALQINPAELVNSVYMPLALRSGPSTPQVNIPPLSFGEPEQVVESVPESELSEQAPEQEEICSTTIQFTNQTGETVYVYWLNPTTNQEEIYQSLPAGATYKQQASYGAQWRIRDSKGTLIKSFAVNTCFDMFINASAAMPTSTPIAACTGNLLLNPSFEVGGNGVAPPSWVASGGSAYQGSGYQVDGALNGYLQATTTSAMIYQNVSNAAIVQNAQVKLSFYGGTHQPTYSHNVSIEFYNASNVKLSASTLIQVDQDVDLSPYYLKAYSVQAYAPAGVSYVRVVGKATGDYLKLDVMCLQVTAAPTSTPTKTPAPPTATSTATSTPPPFSACTNNLIQNPSFEIGGSGVTPPSWTVTAGSAYQGSGYQVHGSLNGYLSTSAGVVASIYQNIPNIAAGTVLNLSFYGGTHQPGYNHNVTIEFYNASNVKLATSTAVAVDRDVDLSPFTLQYYTLQTTAPANTSYARVVGKADGDYIKLDALCLPGPAAPTSTPTNTPTNTPLPVLCTTGCYEVRLINKVTNSDGTTTLTFRFINHCQYDLSFIAFGRGSWNFTYPGDATVYQSSRGNYDVSWMNTSGMPGFPSIKFNASFSGMSNEAVDTYSFTVSNFASTSIIPVAIHSGGGTTMTTLNVDLNSALCQATPPTPTPTPAIVLDTPRIEACTYNLNLTVGQSFNLRNYFHYKDVPLPVNWSQIYFTYTGAGANDPTIPPDWNLSNFNAGNAVTVTSADATATGNHGAGEYRIYIARLGQSGYDDHMTIRVSTDSSNEVNTAQCSAVTPTATPTSTPALASSNGRVWVDASGDGVQNNGEVGAANLTVKLLNSAGSSVLTQTVTAANGAYTFTKLSAGSYIIEFTKPTGYNFTLQDAGGSDTLDSDANPVTGRTTPITLAAGQSIANMDAGIVPLSSASGRVWIDASGDGIQNNGEVGAANLAIRLLDGNGAIVQQTSSAANGAYTFTNVSAGNYMVEFTKPTGYTFTLQDQGGNDLLDSDANPTTGRTATIVLAIGQAFANLDAGLLPLSTTSGRVWTDSSGDGIQNNGEVGAAGLTVKLLDNTGNNVLQQTTSAANGVYSFTNLSAGSYIIEVVKPTGYNFTLQDQGGNDALDSDVNPASGRTGTLALGVGQTLANLDAGIMQPNATNGRIWLDTSADGIQNVGEPAFANVTIKLLDGNGAFLQQTSSAANGSYSFVNLNAGSYIVEFVAATGYNFTLQDQGGNDTLDSDANPANGRTGTLTLLTGQSLNNIDAGFVQPNSSKGRTWNDANGDGMQNAWESSLPNVTVKLLNSQNFGVQQQTTTDANGNYTFTNVSAGSYLIEFIKPTNYSFTLQDICGNDVIDSDANPVTGRTDPLTLTSNQSLSHIDAGLIQANTTSGRVWVDSAPDGLQNAWEVGAASVIVKLLDGNGAFLQQTTSNSNGAYSFANLSAGSYIVEFVKPSGYSFTQQDVGTNDAIDSDANPISGRTNVLTLANGQSLSNVDAGLTRPNSLNGRVWVDSSADGLQNFWEPPLANITIKLLDASGTTVLQETTSDDKGNYSFPNLGNNANYIVEFVAPNGYNFTLKDVGNNDAIDSDVNPATGRTDSLALVSCICLNNVDAGLIQPNTASGRVWVDSSGDGLQNPWEFVAANVIVRLLDSTGTNILQQTTSDSFGAYSFANLSAGSYLVEFAQALNYNFTLQDVGNNLGGNDAIDSDANPVTGRTSLLTLASGQSLINVDAGLLQSNSTSGRVWLDLSGDGTQNVGEPAAANVIVRLLDSERNSVIQETVSNGNGAYSFANLSPDSYIVEFVKPVNHNFTLQNQGNNDALDSDVNPATGRTDLLTVAAGQNLINVDAGLLPPSTTSGRVWIDSSADGLQNNGEPAATNLTVKLLDSTGTNVLQQTTSDVNGSYKFTNLSAGSYIVEFSKPTGYGFTLQDVGNNVGVSDTIDSDANPVTGRTALLTVATGQTLANVDAGIAVAGSTSGRVWLDTSADGLQNNGETGAANVTIKLLNSTGSSVLRQTTSGSDGSYAFNDLIAGSYIVEFVKPSNYAFTLQNVGNDDTTDSDADPISGRTTVISLAAAQTLANVDAGLLSSSTAGGRVWVDSSGNGLQEANESGASNVIVKLLDSTGINTVQSTTSGNGGFYTFTSLLAGNYIIEFVKPNGYLFTLQDRGSDESKDSDANPDTGRTALLQINAGQVVTSIDAGIVQPSSTSGRVWIDSSADGVQNTGELGAANVTVNLLNSAGGFLQQATSGANGVYNFTGLVPATYIVEFVKPSDYFFTKQDQGSDDTKDSDANPLTGRTDPVTLFSGQNRQNVDAGVMPPSTIGGDVWNDIFGDNVQNSGESGIAGIMVNLRDSNGDLITQTTTDANGSYTFTRLAPMSYTVEVLKPGNYIFVTPDQGNSDDFDSDIYPLLGSSQPILLLPGDTILNINAGLFDMTPTATPMPNTSTVSGRAFKDLTPNGVRETGETGMNSLKVELYACSDSATALAVRFTAGGGLYSFSNLVAGCYTVKFYAPSGYLFSAKDQGGDDTIDSDANPTSPTDTSASTDSITLAENEANTTTDVGFYAAPTPTPTPSPTPQQGAIGDRVWKDQNRSGVQEDGEAGYPGIKVNLIGCLTTTSIMTTTTDANGNYRFNNLTGGTCYRVKVTLPAGGSFSLKKLGGNDALDSDTNTSTGITDGVFLPVGQTNMNVDAGISVGVATETRTPTPTKTPTRTPVPTSTPTFTPTPPAP